jgi:monofunctional biosynthetic peptidoglycan transglycosylase
MTDSLIIFDHTKATLQDWHCVNDGVMGGISQSRVSLDKEHTLVWEGKVSLENNGGFASVRYTLPDQNLSAYSGISLRLCGDGKIYKINLANSTSSGSPRFQARFPTSGNPQLVYVPFSMLEASIRGRKVDDVFDPSRLQLVGFLIADQQSGPFRLSVNNISAYV